MNKLTQREKKEREREGQPGTTVALNQAVIVTHGRRIYILYDVLIAMKCVAESVTIDVIGHGLTFLFYTQYPLSSKE